MKIVIVLDESLPRGLLANTAAALALSMAGNLPDVVGEDVHDADNNLHPGLLNTPIPVLGTERAVLKEIREKAGMTADVQMLSFSDVAQKSRSYESYRQSLSQTGEKDLNYLGLCIWGEKKAVSRLTGSLPLIKIGLSDPVFY